MRTKDVTLLSAVSREIKNGGYIISIDSDGVYVKDAREWGMKYEEKIVRVNNKLLNSKEKPTITKKFWFFIDDIEFYSYNDV